MRDDLERDHQQLLEFLYACPVGLVQFDSAGEILMINPYAMKHLLPMAGTRDPANLFAMLEGCAPELRNLFDDYGKERGTVCDGHRIAVDIGAVRKGKDPKVLACTLVKLGADRAMATFTEITVQVAQERRLKQTETWFGSLISGVNDYAVLSLTPEGIIDGVNAAFARQTGRRIEDVAGQALDAILNTDTASGTLSLSDQLRLAERDGWYLDESWQQRRTGERYWCQRLFAVRPAGERGACGGYFVVLRDVARDESDTSDLRRMLLCDHLTGAANRTHFLQAFEREQRRWRQDRQPLSLILLDVDHFKAVNDTYGHPTGDVVLKQLTQVCSAMLRPADLFARLGGEEFAVLLPNTPLDEAARIADRLRQSVEAMVVTADAGPLRITASFGCVTASDACSSVEGLIGLGDTQLYAAKHAGRNRVYTRAALPAAA
ncbi:sensor domain-containing diguanylate cyclase [Sphingomonas sp. TREG-RG-20F-R18-01]|uniref:GGDEF domain-containing protein n=1 Tax=Sphingomonas sp. TREG-RG-20F-R18-01 TaxID=2914982 RepID=UPI001F575FDD|nr:sensor domain-containing diguanylate cyclase [Sphingomonas sp. TREG-RG-20F-R18-01]